MQFGVTFDELCLWMFFLVYFVLFCFFLNIFTEYNKGTCITFHWHSNCTRILYIKHSNMSLPFAHFTIWLNIHVCIMNATFWGRVFPYFKTYVKWKPIGVIMITPQVPNLVMYNFTNAWNRFQCEGRIWKIAEPPQKFIAVLYAFPALCSNQILT